MKLKLRKGKIFLGIDLGSSGLKWVILKKKKKGIEILQYGRVPLQEEAMVAKEIMDRQLVQDALQKAKEEWKYTPDFVAVNVSGKGVIIKRIKIPIQKEQELGEAIEWQVRENVPFDISEVTWDGLLLEEKRGKNADILLTAVKNEVAYSLLDLFGSIGLKINALSTDAISLWNLLSFLKKKIDKDFVILQIGYESTGILTFRDGNIESYREVPIATKIYKEAFIRFLDLPEEEAIKIITGHLPEGVSKEDVLKITDSVNLKLLQQIERISPQFSTQEKKFEKIYLSGGGSFLPGFKEFLEEKMALTVEVLNVFESFKVPLSSDEERFLGPLFNLAVGFALQGLRKEITLNLLPYEERPKETKSPLGIGSVGTLLIPILITLFLIYANQKTKVKRIESLESKVKRAEKEDTRLKKQVKEISILESKEKEIKSRIEIIRNLEKGRFAVLKFLDEVNRTIPDGVWLTSLGRDKKDQSNVWSIKGAALAVQDIVKFIQNLKKSPYLKDPELVLTERKKMGNQKAVAFEIKVSMKKG